jgi:hypothetical protein
MFIGEECEAELEFCPLHLFQPRKWDKPHGLSHLMSYMM